MKKNILISLLVGMMGVMAFMGCEKQEPIVPNEDPQQPIEDTTIVQDPLLTYFVGEWECIDYRYSNYGGLFLRFSMDSLFATNNAIDFSHDFDGNEYPYQIQSLFNYPANGREDDNGYTYRVETDDTLRTYFEYIKENYGQDSYTLFIDQIPNNPIYILNLDIPVEYSRLAIHVISSDTVSLHCTRGCFSHAEDAPSKKYNFKRIR